MKFTLRLPIICEAQKECPLQIEETPSLYLYRLIMGEHEQIGVVACAQ